MNWNAARDAVRRLVEVDGCVMMKIATEDEALTHDEIRRRVDVFGEVVPIEVKIGGPGARGDIALAKALGLRHIIAPMIESPYGLTDFLAGVREIYGKKAPILGINIETGIAARSVSSILDVDRDRGLSQVTVGRGDLSKSLGLSVHDDAVTRISARVIRIADTSGYATSVGGGVEPWSIETISKKIGPRFVNTRNFMFSADIKGDVIVRAIQAEILICRATGTKQSLARVAALRARLKK